MYILFLEGYIQRYSPKTEVIFRPRQKKNPEGTALPDRFFFAEDEKNRGGGGYIVVYSPMRIIYIINMPHFLSQY